MPNGETRGVDGTRSGDEHTNQPVTDASMLFCLLEIYRSASHGPGQACGLSLLDWEASWVETMLRITRVIHDLVYPVHLGKSPTPASVGHLSSACNKGEFGALR